jgi:glycosyltransferase involved in cell wall biosynthesis
MTQTEESCSQGPRPLVSIGLPVYNGQNFVRDAIACVQKQTFQDWELVISDNCSMDRTVAICREFAARDPRIRVFENSQNLGAAPNFNRVFELARGKYFKWLAHDDFCAPEFVDRCLAVLEANPDVALAVPNLVYVDAGGRPIRRQQGSLQLLDDSPAARVKRLMQLEGQSSDIFWTLYGLVRRDLAGRTKLMQSFNACDQVLILEFALQGKFAQVNEDLFFRREHAEAASLRTGTTAVERARLTDASDRRRLVFPYWRLFAEHLRALRVDALSVTQRGGCAAYVARRFTTHWKDMAHEVVDNLGALILRRNDGAV